MSQTTKTSTKKENIVSIDFDTAVFRYYKLKHDYEKSNKLVKELYNNIV